MAKKKNNSNGKPSRASKRRARKSNASRYNGPQMMGAPAGVSQDLQQFTRFYPSKGNRGIRMHTCAAICELLRETTAAVSGGVQLPGGIGVSVQLNLTDPVRLAGNGTAVQDDYISPVFDLIASAFVRYRVDKLVFHYEPQASSLTDERMVFAFAQDPVHPILWSSTPPGTTELLAMSDSIAFAPWRAWSMNVTSQLEENLFYVYTDPSSTVPSFADRFSDFGVISCSGTATEQAGLTVAGVVYMEIVIELEEFCPIVLTAPAAAKHLTETFNKCQLATRSSPSAVKIEHKPKETSLSKEKSVSVKSVDRYLFAQDFLDLVKGYSPLDFLDWDSFYKKLLNVNQSTGDKVPSQVILTNSMDYWDDFFAHRQEAISSLLSNLDPWLGESLESYCSRANSVFKKLFQRFSESEKKSFVTKAQMRYCSQKLDESNSQ